jgi:YtcA family
MQQFVPLKYTARACGETARPLRCSYGALNVARCLGTICSLKGSAVCMMVARPARVLMPLALCVPKPSGCDPVINITGAGFPSWLICLIAGALLTAVLRPLFLKLRPEPYMDRRYWFT